MNHLIIFNVLVWIKNEKKINYSKEFYLDQTGFCTAFDEDFNQTLKFQIKTINNLDYEIIFTDNGQPPSSVNLIFFLFK